METNQAAEHLQVIRTLMERSAIYRRALAPIMTFCGVLGISGGLIGRWLKIESDRNFVFFWSGVAVLALIGSFLLVRRQALKESEPFWSPPTRRVAQALLPPFFAGLFLSIVTFWLPEDDAPLIQCLLVALWAWLYGFAIYSAGFFVPRGMRLFGWIFVISGCILIVLARAGYVLTSVSAHLLMGLTFGGLHLAYGIYLYFTENRKSAS
jgi:hypothetical protein